MAWLRTLPRGALDLWEAFDSVEPIGEEWEQSAMVAEQIAVATYAQAGMEPPERAAFMPRRFRPERKKVALDIPSPETNREQFAGLVTMLQKKG